MPIDSRRKRLSMLTFGSDDLLPDPDAGGTEADDRMTLLGLYGGVAAAVAVAAALVREAIGKISRKRTKRPVPVMLPGMPTGMPAVVQASMRTDAQAIVDVKPQFQNLKQAPPLTEAPIIAPTLDLSNKQAADVARSNTLAANTQNVSQARRQSAIAADVRTIKADAKREAAAPNAELEGVIRPIVREEIAPVVKRVKKLEDDET